VRIDRERLEALAAELHRSWPAAAPPGDDRRRLESDAATLAFALTLNALNFGSGWFPHLAKLPGKSGYRTVAARLREWFESHGPLGADELARFTPEKVAAVLGQTLEPPVEGLMEIYARSLVDLGRTIRQDHDGSFENLVREAGGSAERLVRAMARMPLYRDVASYEGLEVSFYKRAQILAADLHGLFGDSELGTFRDLDSLTCFADNLVPHVLRMRGVLTYDPELAHRIDERRLLAPGSAEEVEVRASAVQAVEELSAALEDLGRSAPPRILDELLWTAGQSPEMKAVPRHRARCPYY
jgi:hypothetical protein